VARNSSTKTKNGHLIPNRANVSLNSLRPSATDISRMRRTSRNRKSIFEFGPIRTSALYSAFTSPAAMRFRKPVAVVLEEESCLPWDLRDVRAATVP